MTITYCDKFAFKPKRCWKCNKLFWLEPYYIREATVSPFGIVSYIYCSECGEASKERENYIW